ncbi:oxidoreductase [Thiomonas sp. FB-6]|uniref:oxidoreductase n=1 Tax=Thiomonas sp. FB-6 TaxID=1158291 RepID=UPI0003796234|nr:oxidoreductase [Thiomonas sp. FB-6]
MVSKTAPRTWFITGASSGFGAAFARHALELGDNVVATARNSDALEELVALEPHRVLAVTLDVTRPGQARQAVEHAVQRFGRIDILVNNAGYGIVGAVEETPEDEWRAQMETNFFGAVAVIQAALPRMREQRAGAIVNISSLGGQVSFAGFGAYSASKFALEGLSEALAQELAPFGIRVLIVEPGAFRTGFAGSSALRNMPEMQAYQDVVGGTRRFAQGMHGTQAGDPMKAARAVARALQAPDAPLRLQLGQDAVDAVREHAQRLLRDLGAWESVALDTSLAQA